MKEQRRVMESGVITILDFTNIFDSTIPHLEFMGAKLPHRVPISHWRMEISPQSAAAKILCRSRTVSMP